VTAQSQAEISALNSVWPHRKKKQKFFFILHVCQALWRWIWDSKHSIIKEDRPKLMADFQKILKSFSIEQAKEAYRNALLSGISYIHTLAELI
jgi:hypothetical protein